MPQLMHFAEEQVKKHTEGEKKIQLQRQMQNNSMNTQD